MVLRSEHRCHVTQHTASRLSLTLSLSSLTGSVAALEHSTALPISIKVVCQGVGCLTTTVGMCTTHHLTSVEPIKSVRTDQEPSLGSVRAVSV